MFAKEAIMFIVCFSLAFGLVGSTGIFSEVDNPSVSAVSSAYVSQYDKDNVSNLGILDYDPSNGGISDAVGLSEAIQGYKLIQFMWGALKTSLKVLLYPYGILYDAGVPSMFAAAIQVVVNIASIFGVIQYLTNRSFKTIE